jgi:hypothetical protein
MASKSVSTAGTSASPSSATDAVAVFGRDRERQILTAR